ncbi:EamA family transporter [Neisseria leonii]|uniref:EamA family transporter n=1 Tax=Neisseria leonii TaxID=2995413 RepID=UPI00345FA40F
MLSVSKRLALLFFTILLWGTVWYTITFQLNGTPVLVSVFYRIVIAAIFLLIYKNLFYCTNIKIASIKNHLKVSVLGGCLFSINYLFFYLATEYISSGLVAIIFSTLIIFNSINKYIFLI